MKCDACLNLLEEYIDGEVVEHDAEQISAHLVTCARCANEFDLFMAQQEIYARYDRELEIPPAMWNTIAARTVAESSLIESRSRFRLGAWVTGWLTLPRFGIAFSGAVAVLIAAVVIGVVYLRTPEQPPKQMMIAGGNNNIKPTRPAAKATGAMNSPPRIEVKMPLSGSGVVHQRGPSTSQIPAKRKSNASDQPDVLFTDAAYSDIEDRDTASHLEQAQNLLRSIGNLQPTDDEEEIDVSYEKAESRRLLNENIVLRRDAEMAGKFPAKSLLGSLEPFLIDIANLPEKASPGELRQIKERVQRTEIVAALQGY
jgi:hypothetical protein